MAEPVRTYLEAIVHQLPCRPIHGADGSVYLYRYTLRDLDDGGHVYLHRFMRSDEDQELHNHPWSAQSLILAGGYCEERRAGDRVVESIYIPGSLVVIAPDTFHRFDLLEHDCWSLCTVGPRVQDWGFWDRHSGAFTQWEEFVRRKGMVPA